MSNESNNQQEINTKMRKQFTNSLLNSDIDKKIIAEIMGDEKTFLLFFNIYLIGCKDMYYSVVDFGEKVAQENKEKGDDGEE